MDGNEGMSVVQVIDWQLKNPDVCLSLRELHRDLAAPRDLVCESLSGFRGLDWRQFLEAGLVFDGVSVALMRMDRHYYADNQYSLGRMQRKFWSHGDNYQQALKRGFEWAQHLEQQEIAEYQQFQGTAKSLIGRNRA